MMSKKVKKIIIRFLETVTEENPEGDWKQAIIDVYGWDEDCPYINQYLYAVKKQLEQYEVIRKLVRATMGSTAYLSTHLKKEFFKLLDRMDKESIEELKDIASLYDMNEKKKVEELIDNASTIIFKNKVRRFNDDE